MVRKKPEMAKINWQDPPAVQLPVTDPTVAAVMKKPSQWALVATVGWDELPSWWSEVIMNPNFNYQISPVLSDDPNSDRNIYIMYNPPHQH